MQDLNGEMLKLAQSRLGSANLNIHLHYLVFDGVYRIQKGALKFHSVLTPITEQLTSAFDCSTG
ncbi:hypothetical protein [Nitrosomonas sp. Nm33]|uniref:hypothetical protein n=1 Tax=Nitrosomonas sp. Nm33 TaxID=133724 RepID=UPI000896EA24|nr:hypothetical protein [Nitrosomonas sp. Nm33]SDY94816.1 hypothetical protein SAMN05421755_10708 [Nitrosomonas sp. Nm33]